MTRQRYIRRRNRAIKDFIAMLICTAIISASITTIAMLSPFMVERIKETKAIREEYALYEQAVELTAQGYSWNIERVDVDDEDYNKWQHSIRKPTHNFDNYITFSSAESSRPIKDGSQVDFMREYIGAVEAQQPKLLDTIFSDGWQIQVITPEEMNNLVSKDGISILGLTRYAEHTIYINGWNGYCVIHEIGHVLYNDYGFSAKLKEAGYDKYDSNGLDTVYTHIGHYTPYGYVAYEEHICDLWHEYFLYPREFELQDPVLFKIYDDFAKSFNS